MSSEPPETTPAPGWYEDPHGGGDGLRWWDGSAWTEHTLDDVPPSDVGFVEEEPPAVAAEPVPAPAASTEAPDADSLMAMYGARRVGAPRPGSGGPDFSRYKLIIGILVLGLIAMAALLLLIGGGDDDLSTGVGSHTTTTADAQSLLRTAQTALTITDPPGENSYTIARQGTGAVTFSCTPGGTPGCPPGGNWEAVGWEPALLGEDWTNVLES